MVLRRGAHFYNRPHCMTTRGQRIVKERGRAVPAPTGCCLGTEEGEHSSDQVGPLVRGPVLLEWEGQEHYLVGAAERERVGLGGVVGEDASRRAVGCDLVHEVVGQKGV